MSKLKLFNDRQIRTHWDAEKEEWFFSVIDVCGVLAESDNPRKYWSVLKTRLKKEGSQLATNCSRLKLLAEDGKMRVTDTLDAKGILRLIQSIPSKNAEPFKIWLAEVGSQRLDEMADPEKAILRGADYYRQKGYTEGWINQRLQAIEMRKELTDEWKARGVTNEKDYGILTNEMTKSWSGMTTSEYKGLKGLKKENLRDNMTNIELALNMLAEVSTTAISKANKPATMKENKSVAKQGGTIAKNAKTELEQAIGKSVISSQNAKNKLALEENINLTLED